MRRFATPFVLVLASAQLAPAQTSNPPPPVKPAPPPKAPPKSGRIIQIEAVGDGTVVTVPLGTSHGVDRTWKARVVDDHDKPVANGALEIIRVDKQVTRLKSKLAMDELKTLRVQLEP